MMPTKNIITETQIEKAFQFIKNNMEFENRTITEETEDRIRRVLRGVTSHEEAMEEVRHKYQSTKKRIEYTKKSNEK